MARVYSIEKVKNLFTKVSLTNQYKLEIAAPPPLKSKDFFTRGDSNTFGGLDEKISIMCRSAELSGQSLETITIYGARQGVFESFPTSRRFPPLNCTFYVDKDHDVLRFFSEWMEYINPLQFSSGPIESTTPGFPVSTARGTGDGESSNFYKMQYKDNYFAPSLTITKFEKDSIGGDDRFRPRRSEEIQEAKGLVYKFYRAFPREIVSTPVTYDNADVLQLTIVFEYERLKIS